MSRIITFLFFILLTLQAAETSSHALVFDRRPRPASELSYYVYPVAGSLPGVQDFGGAGVSVLGLGGSETDIALIHLTGAADYFDNKDFEITLFTLLDLPVIWENLNFSAFYIDISNGTWPEGERGIHSDPNSTYYLLGSKFLSKGGEVSVNFWDYQFEAYLGFMDNAVEPYGLIDPQGTRYDARDAHLNKYPRGYRWGLYLDDTDDRRDPRIGYRAQYERWNMPQTRNENSAFFQQDYNFTGYIPADADHTKVWVLNYFESSAHVTKEGEVDQSRFQCPPGAPAGCQAVLDELYRRQLENATMGKATALGGANRLRGYRTNRFYDAFSAFRGLEYRWYLMETQEAFDYLVEKGVFAGLQIAFFLEQGTVAPTHEQLWAAKVESHGAAFRIILNTVVVRFDVGFSEEGQQNTLFFGYPF